MWYQEEEERRQRQVLVLGLDGAGKSSVLQQLNGSASKRKCTPTRGFNFIRLHTPACEFDFLESKRMSNVPRPAHIFLHVIFKNNKST